MSIAYDQPANSIISVGGSFRNYDSSVQTHNKLPVGTYRVAFSPLTGFSLEQTADLQVGDEKVYGNHEARLDRIISTHRALDGSRSLGVMLSGDKGMGKSMMLRMLAEAAITELGLPVIVVDANYPGIADYLDSWGAALVIFDEFEKVFPLQDADGDNAQNQFLGLFDGMSSVPRIYALSLNQVHSVSDYLLNRPGRFHYHMRFTYPGPEEVRAYLQDQAPQAAAEEVDKVVVFSRKVAINYDHLRAIAFEIGPLGQRFDEVISDLNIKRVDASRYAVEVTFDNGVIMRGDAHLDLFATDATRLPEVRVSCTGGHAYLELNVSQIQPQDQGMALPGHALAVTYGEMPNGATFHEAADAETFPKATAATLQLQGQHNLEY